MEDILYKGDAEACDNFICVTNPEGFNFIEDNWYTISGQGPLAYSKKQDKYVIDYGSDIYGHNLTSRNEYSNKHSSSEYIKIPNVILIRHFISSEMFKNEVDMFEFIKCIRRDRNIDKILK